jgi:copper chaperone CopZ
VNPERSDGRAGRVYARERSETLAKLAISERHYADPARRVDAFERLLGAIDAAPDLKASTDLANRVAVENGFTMRAPAAPGNLARHGCSEPGPRSRDLAEHHQRGRDRGLRIRAAGGAPESRHGSATEPSQGERSMNTRRLTWLVALLSCAAALGTACQMSPLSRACLQEQGCERHPINLVVPQLVLAAEPQPRVAVFQVKGMTCALCVKAIERAPRELEGIERVVIDAKSERVTVVSDPKVTAGRVQAAITAAGFEAVPLPDP